MPDVFCAFNYFSLIIKWITLDKLISSTIANETIVKIIVVLSFLGISFSIMSGEIDSSCKLTAYAAGGHEKLDGTS